MVREIKYFSTPKRTSVFISGMQAFPLNRLVFIKNYWISKYK